MLFALWRSNRIRRTNSLVDLFWSFGLFLLLFAHIGLVIPMLGLGIDSDYSGFIDHIPVANWQGNAFLLFILVVNGSLLRYVIPHLLKLRRLFALEQKEK